MNDKEFLSHKENSRRNWGESFGTESTSKFPKKGFSVLSFGCLQRIAEATELMSKNYLEMQNSLDHLNTVNKQRIERIKKLEKSNAALKGHIKRLKNKLNK